MVGKNPIIVQKKYEELRKKYNIPKSRIITEEIKEADVLVKNKIDVTSFFIHVIQNNAKQ